ncbi:MAG: hypothetical protein EXQ91_09345 [Alphaproteobacteria bacterium]|nr:hypothetical protein [Alphaproteobacteria bacterium]
MPHVVIRHKVKDFDAWKKVFDAGDEFRASLTLANPRLFRMKDDPNEVVLLMELTDVPRYRAHLASDRHRERAKLSGVADDPDFFILDEVPLPRA